MQSIKQDVLVTVKIFLIGFLRKKSKWKVRPRKINLCQVLDAPNLQSKTDGTISFPCFQDSLRQPSFETKVSMCFCCRFVTAKNAQNLINKNIYIFYRFFPQQRAWIIPRKAKRNFSTLGRLFDRKTMHHDFCVGILIVSKHAEICNSFHISFCSYSFFCINAGITSFIKVILIIFF